MKEEPTQEDLDLFNNALRKMQTRVNLIPNEKYVGDPYDNTVNSLQNLLTRALPATPDKRQKYVATALSFQPFNEENPYPARAAVTQLLFNAVNDLASRYWKQYDVNPNWIPYIASESSKNLAALSTTSVHLTLLDVANMYELSSAEQKNLNAVASNFLPRDQKIQSLQMNRTSPVHTSMPNQSEDSTHVERNMVGTVMLMCDGNETTAFEAILDAVGWAREQLLI